MGKIKVELIFNNGGIFNEVLDIQMVQLMMQAGQITVKNKTLSVQYKEIDTQGIARFYGYETNVLKNG